MLRLFYAPGTISVVAAITLHEVMYYLASTMHVNHAHKMRGSRWADPYLFVISTWLAGDGVDMSAFSKLTGFMQNMETRASVKAVRAAGML